MSYIFILYHFWLLNLSLETQCPRDAHILSPYLIHIISVVFADHVTFKIPVKSVLPGRRPTGIRVSTQNEQTTNFHEISCFWFFVQRSGLR